MKQITSINNQPYIDNYFSFHKTIPLSMASKFLGVPECSLLKFLNLINDFDFNNSDFSIKNSEYVNGYRINEFNGEKQICVNRFGLDRLFYLSRTKKDKLIECL